MRVNAVAPGLVETPWTNPWPDERKQATIERTLLAKAAKPIDIAQAMLFLAVHGHINGETIVVDGGFRLRRAPLRCHSGAPRSGEPGTHKHR